MMITKKRDFKGDKYARFIMDALLLAVLFAICYLYMLDKSFAVYGFKNLFVVGMVHAVLIMVFMVLLEEYSLVVSGFWEQMVIFTLSSFYAWIIISVLNLLLFGSGRLFLITTVVSVCAVAVLGISNYIRNRLYQNEEKHPKQKLLILETREKNFMRMKRIKYGTLARYDSWYEFVNTDSLDEVQKFIDEKFSDFDVICMLDEISGDAYDLIIARAMAMDKAVYVVPKMIDIQKNSAKLVRFDDIMTFYIQEYSLSYFESFLKRASDIAIGLIGLVFAIIPMGLIAAAIKLTSPGPVFYKQTRLTKGKREFEIYKFRTMVPDAEKLTGPVFAQKDDPRITKVGKILRACRLDELPQLINILRGDMSIVGPRPERPAFVAEFEKEIENYNYRFAVKAGLTSLSHVYGRYSTYILDRTCYDLYYITHYSILLDLKIILLTTKTMFLKSAAEGDDEFKLAGTENADNKEAAYESKV